MHLDATIGGARERLDDRPICQHVTQAHGVGRLPYVGNYILEVLAELDSSLSRWSLERPVSYTDPSPPICYGRAQECVFAPTPLQLAISMFGEKRLEQWGKAMIHSSHQGRKAKAIAEVLAMIADTHPELTSQHPRPVRDLDEWLWESATEFCAALDLYAGRVMQVKRENH